MTYIGFCNPGLATPGHVAEPFGPWMTWPDTDAIFRMASDQPFSEAKLDNAPPAERVA